MYNKPVGAAIGRPRTRNARPYMITTVNVHCVTMGDAIFAAPLFILLAPARSVIPSFADKTSEKRKNS